VSWWEDHYRRGGNSGSGSYGLLAEFKAEVLNDLIRKHQVETAIEFGCGDGNQLEKIRCSQYVGLDVSETAIRRCRNRFRDDPTKTFMLLKEWPGGRFDLALSMDVIYHLIDDDEYEEHMEGLFRSAPLVVVYSTNHDGEVQPNQIRHRQFTEWTDLHVSDWTAERIANPYPHLSPAEFYIFQA
jgi:SAM-dependent methyltransferase